MFTERRRKLCEFNMKSLAYEITCNGLTPNVAMLVYDILGKPPTTPYDDLKFAVLEHMVEPKLEFSRQLYKELMNGVAEGPQPQKGSFPNGWR
ncbi:hypothetical protein ACTXT7_004242 [Hymenolepis weldensis]